MNFKLTVTISSEATSKLISVVYPTCIRRTNLFPSSFFKQASWQMNDFRRPHYILENKETKTECKSCSPSKSPCPINKSENNYQNFHKAISYIIKETIAIKLFSQQFVFVLKPFLIHKLGFFIPFISKEPSLYEKACSQYCSKQDSNRSYPKQFKPNDQQNSNPKSNKIAGQSKWKKESKFSVYNSHSTITIYPIILTNFCIFYKYILCFDQFSRKCA